MCIAIVKPEGKQITKKVLRHCFEQNPDGAGFAIPSGSRKEGVKVVKGLFTFRQFWNEYKKYKDQNKPMLIHFRLSTCANIDGNNCHPHRINSKYAMIHNGILAHKIGLEHDEVSDSGLFAANILQPIIEANTRIWKKSHFKWLIEKSMGDNNKVAILSNTGNYTIYNESQGEWVDGIWFSNDTYKTERKKKSYTFNSTKTASSADSPVAKKSVLALPYSPKSDIINQIAPPKPQPLQIDLTKFA